MCCFFLFLIFLTFLLISIFFMLSYFLLHNNSCLLLFISISSLENRKNEKNIQFWSILVGFVDFLVLSLLFSSIKLFSWLTQVAFIFYLLLSSVFLFLPWMRVSAPCLRLSWWGVQIFIWLLYQQSWTFLLFCSSVYYFIYFSLFSYFFKLFSISCSFELVVSAAFHLAFVSTLSNLPRFLFVFPFTVLPSCSSSCSISCSNELVGSVPFHLTFVSTLPDVLLVLFLLFSSIVSPSSTFLSCSVRVTLFHCFLPPHFKHSP